MLAPAEVLLMLKPGDQCVDCHCLLLGLSNSLPTSAVHVPASQRSLVCLLLSCMLSGGNMAHSFYLEWTPCLSICNEGIVVASTLRDSLSSIHFSLALTISVHVGLTFLCQHLRFIFLGALSMLPDCSAHKHSSCKCQGTNVPWEWFSANDYKYPSSFVPWMGNGSASSTQYPRAPWGIEVWFWLVVTACDNTLPPPSLPSSLHSPTGVSCNHLSKNHFHSNFCLRFYFLGSPNQDTGLS